MVMAFATAMTVSPTIPIATELAKEPSMHRRAKKAGDIARSDAGKVARLRSLVLVCATMLLLPAEAWGTMSRDQAAAVATRLSGGGRVLAVERAEWSGRAFWRVKLLTATGDVTVVELPPGDAAPRRP